MRPELIVAEKEFRDHITSKRFILIFGIMLLLAIYSINLGMDSYNQQLDSYKKQADVSNPDTKRIIDNYQQMIQDAKDRGDPPQSIQTMQDTLDRYLNPQMPSVLQIFNAMLLLFTFVGMILGAALGFDQIARERDEGSLKFLVSSPIYRDAIINGKTIGAILTLGSAMVAAFAITIAIVLLKGVVPGLDDMIRVTLFFIAGLLYCMVFFALAMVMSALSKNTAMAAIFTVGMVFAVFVYTVLAVLAANMITDSILGPPPVYNYLQPHYPVVVVNESEGGTTTYPSTYDDSGYQEYYSEYQNYSNRRTQTQADISGILSAFSPIDSFSGYLGYGHMGVGQAMITRQNTAVYMYVPSTDRQPQDMSILDSLSSVWMRTLIMIAEIMAAFGIAYVAFMRTDVR